MISLLLNYGGVIMSMVEDDLKNRVKKLENKTATLETKFEVLMTKLDMFITETRENRTRQDEEMRQLRNKIDLTVTGMFITVAIGITAMVIAVLLK